MENVRTKTARARLARAFLLLVIFNSPFSIFHSLSSSAGEPEPAACADIRDAFLKGGPLASCWNVQTGWNLNQQVEWIKQGHRYYPTIFVPLSAQGAGNETRANAWLAEHREALEFINRYKLPVCLRWHNWINELWYPPRLPFESSPLVFRRLPDGSLDDMLIADPLGPVLPWREAGQRLGGSLWLSKLAELLPDTPQVFLLENNEGNIAEEGNYTTPIAGAGGKDAWGYRKRQWREDLESASVRMATYAAHHSADDCLVAINRGYRERYEQLTTGILESLPASLAGKATTGGYAGLGELSESGLLGQTFSYRRPQTDWEHSPWAPIVWRFTEASERCYDDGSGSPWNWHDWVRGPHVLQHNLAPLVRYLDATRGPLWHDDRSFYLSPQRARTAALEHGGYVLPERLLGFARASLWSVRAGQRATVLRWFANSQEKLENRWFDAANDPAELAHLTHGDYFASVMAAVDEVWESPLLLLFWREGQPILSPDPALCDWELPPSISLPGGGAHTIVDDRSRVLASWADEPRFMKDSKGRTIDTWRQADGKLELRVFAQGWRLPGPEGKPLDLIYAWSPRTTRENVVVEVPGRGPVLFDKVDPSGEWRLFLQ